MNNPEKDSKTQPGSCLAPLQRDRQTKSPGFVAINGLPGYFFNEKHDVIGPRGWILKITKCNRGGYPIVSVIASGKKKIVRIHRLIALQFIPNPENLKEVNHKNGIKSDYRIENLEWTTHKKNVQHSYDTGLKIGMIGERHPLAKVDRAGVLAIREAKGIFPQKQIAKYFGMSTHSTVSAIQLRKNWAHIE